ncbi:MAG: ParA family protein [Oscillospiraceae bacterium]|jgi:cellulose biosynthesis protein BcsQ|nr:ParA family protein [Oscillospiraceae bacterium]
MADSLALISGKGGSGKTTLAIAISQLLAKCGLSVLLVDCDMSTHGATYFFEDLLTRKSTVFTLKRFFDDPISTPSDTSVLLVMENFYFIPSQIDYSEKFAVSVNAPQEGHNTQWNKRWETFLEDKSYDIVIYDCQSGYSATTEAMLNYANKKLAVLELDAVSATALRVLYAQLSSKLERTDGKTYQIYNKLTRSEVPDYRKFKNSTFTTQAPIPFDWSIRDDFMKEKLPDIESSNPRFARAILSLTRNLFPACREKIKGHLGAFESAIKRAWQIELEKKRKADIMSKAFLLIPAMCFVSFCLILSFTFPLNFERPGELWLKIVPLVVLLSSVLLSLFFAQYNSALKPKERLKRQTEINELETYLEELKEKA